MCVCHIGMYSCTRAVHLVAARITSICFMKDLLSTVLEAIGEVEGASFAV